MIMTLNSHPVPISYYLDFLFFWSHWMCEIIQEFRCPSVRTSNSDFIYYLVFSQKNLMLGVRWCWRAFTGPAAIADDITTTHPAGLSQSSYLLAGWAHFLSKVPRYLVSSRTLSAAEKYKLSSGKLVKLKIVLCMLN